MDNENIRIEFVNGSTVTRRYESYPYFQHVNRGHRATGLVYDEFAYLDRLGDYSGPLVDMFNSVQTGYTISPDELQDCLTKRWYEVGKYKLYIDGDEIAIKQKEAPDFGELSPSQELNDFVNTLVQGE